MNNEESASYNAISKEASVYLGNIAFSDEQNEHIQTRMAQYSYAYVNDKCSVEEFCASVFSLMEEMYFMSLNFSEAVLARWYTTSGRPMSKEEKELRESPLEMEIFLISSFIRVEVLKRKPKVAKSPVFYEFVRKVILDGRFERGRTGFIHLLLPKTKKSEGIDFIPFVENRFYAGSTFIALLNLKDGRFVKEVERFLEREPKHFYRRQIERYIERYKENE